MKILIVEDDSVIASEIAASLREWGFEAVCAENFEDISQDFCAAAPDLVVMDVSLPQRNGFYWCQQIRKSSSVPVLFLSSRTDDLDVVTAVNNGADDYLAKPVSMNVLMAKIQALLRRAYDYELTPRLTLRGAVLDPGGSFLLKDEARTELTKNEARLLRMLLLKKGAAVSREELMIELWEGDDFIDDNTLTVNVNRLRRTLEAAGLCDCISTVKGLGYRLDE